MNELTQEQREDVEKRQQEFFERYEALVKELDIDFAPMPITVPMGNGLFGLTVNPVLQDKKYLTPLSPIQP